jgi:hypothetical protein
LTLSASTGAANNTRIIAHLPNSAFILRFSFRTHRPDLSPSTQVRTQAPDDPANTLNTFASGPSGLQWLESNQGRMTQRFISVIEAGPGRTGGSRKERCACAVWFPAV